MAFTGIYPVFDIQFEIDVTSRSGTPQYEPIKEMETFSIAIDGNVQEWTPMETEGWVRRLMTGKSFTLTLNGKRHVGDPGNDYVANTAWKSGLDCSTSMRITFPSGAQLEFDCILNVTEAEGGESTDVAALSVEVMSDGKPVYTPPQTP